MRLFDENRLTAVIERLPDGTFRAHIPEIDGISADGVTEVEAEDNLLEALKVIKHMAKRDEWKKKMGYL